ncbi:hypothetical protein VULLAG_LOCUS10987 [Vulpes lagopus]
MEALASLMAARDELSKQRIAKIGHSSSSPLLPHQGKLLFHLCILEVRVYFLGRNPPTTSSYFLAPEKHPHANKPLRGALHPPTQILHHHIQRHRE